MIRVVFDTNILVSAILSPKSSPARILGMAVSGEIRLIISPAIFEKVKKVLYYPKIQKVLQKRKISPGEVDNFLRKLSLTSRVVVPKEKINIIKKDPSDNVFLECAVFGGADFIISGDIHLKELKNYRGISIVNPTGFLEVFFEK